MANDDLTSIIEGLLDEALGLPGVKVATLYRADVVGGHAPLLWRSGRPDATPSYVSPSSDMAAFLRVNGTRPMDICCSSFKDGYVRRSMNEFGVSHLFALPVFTNGPGTYHATFGSEGVLGSRAKQDAIGLTNRMSRLFNKAINNALCQGLALRPTDELPNDKELRACSRLLHAVLEGVEANEVAALLASAFDAKGATIEDTSGRVVGLFPNDRAGEVARDWLSAIPHLPYLDLMRHRHQAFFVPAEPEAGEPSRVVAPIVDGGEVLGIITVLDTDEKYALSRVHTVRAAQLASAHFLRTRQASRGRVLDQALNSVENERLRIACELHDETSQNLVALKVLLSTSKLAFEKGDHEGALRIMEDCQCIADGILEGVNRLSADLRPSELNYLGLRPAIEAEAQRRLGRTGIAYTFSGNSLDVSFNHLQERMLLSGVVEALSNCAKHSHASRVEVAIDDDGTWLTLAVRDDGQGFDAEALDTGAMSGGLKTMRDCAEAIGGSFWIGSTPGVGTTVRFGIPTHLLEESL